MESIWFPVEIKIHRAGKAAETVIMNLAELEAHADDFSGRVRCVITDLEEKAAEAEAKGWGDSYKFYMGQAAEIRTAFANFYYIAECYKELYSKSERERQEVAARLRQYEPAYNVTRDRYHRGNEVLRRESLDKSYRETEKEQ